MSSVLTWAVSLSGRGLRENRLEQSHAIQKPRRDGTWHFDVQKVLNVRSISHRSWGVLWREIDRAGTFHQAILVASGRRVTLDVSGAEERTATERRASPVPQRSHRK